MSLLKSYGSDLVILKIVSLPGVVISLKSSLLIRAQNVLEVIDWGGSTKFAILLITGANASFWSFEIAHIVLLIISSLIFLEWSICSIVSFVSEMKSTRIL